MKCDKITHRIYRKAKNRADHLNKKEIGRRSNSGKYKPARVYKCKVCNKYHITHMTIKEVSDLNERQFIKEEGERWERHFDLL